MSLKRGSCQGYVFGLDESGSAITPALIAALGEMPYGKNYLSAHVETIMGDPIFTDVRDRSNANFLWFIKFEKSFRETEQELQNAGVYADDIAQAAFLKNNHKDNTGTQHETTFGSDAQIIQLYDAFEKREGSDRAQSISNNGGGAEIIYLR